MRHIIDPRTGDPDVAEAALVEGLRRGDDQAYARLLRLYGPSMLARARYLLQNEEDAHDALQLALVSVFRHIGAFEGRAKLPTWLHAVVTNAALTVRRQRHRRTRLEQPLGEGALVPAPAEGSPERQALEGQRRRVLARALDGLAPSYRAVVDGDLAGHSSEDTAVRLSISRSALKSRRFRAFQMLRARMAAGATGQAASAG
ncbi:MAG: RNA polymerase sigma factor [Vicinamibacterales bacterium]|nr:RNA polymerase sigma factor [Vicinamibacterales bacterium]